MSLKIRESAIAFWTQHFCLAVIKEIEETGIVSYAGEDDFWGREYSEGYVDSLCVYRFHD